jgi:hypothetical protein
MQCARPYYAGMELSCFMSLHVAILVLTFLTAVIGTCLTEEATPPVPADLASPSCLPIYETSIDFATPSAKFSKFEERLDMPQALP